ncbi:hypothetical protein CMO91_06355 [Candidatus Woesearchaeota archaeon]|nr:hypothetical protein [Candidatus Woesearchaeota archaeon]
MAEGDYWVFNHYADFTSGTSALAIMQEQDGELVDVWDPCDHHVQDELNEGVSKLALEWLVHKGVKKVLSTDDATLSAHSTTFKGYPLHNCDTHDWWHYDGIKNDHYWPSLFREYDITLEVVNPQDDA